MSSRKDREPAVAGHRSIPKITDRDRSRICIGAERAVIGCRDKTRVLERAQRGLGEHALRKNHHPVECYSSFRLVLGHSLERLLGLGTKALSIGNTKFGMDMIASMNRQRVNIRIFSKEAGDFWFASGPVPRNKCYARGKIVLLHERQQFIKVQKAVPTGQQRVVDDNASIRFGRFPTNMCKRPFDIEHDG